MRKITIAIDGFSSTGKSTLAKQLAKELNYSYVDTGAMYRAVALYAMKNDLSHKQLISSLDQININFKFLEETQANTTFLNGKNVEQEIRGMEVSNRVSEIATISEVRAELVRQQKEMGKNKAVVMDGRDIGTVVFPDAELKIFMTADPEIRAKRRHDELLAKGDAPSFEEVYNNLQKRDNEDRNRLDSPLLQAKDALVLDNSEITHEQQFAQALDWAKEKITE
ncbi:MAG: (d)CMP kinase [Schleiferiaceae bacterium]|nr:(d)CMP kinase [Schleiferiaceae bacterium]